MKEQIDNLKAVFNHALANGAFKNIETAAQAINSIIHVEQKANLLQQENEQAASLIEILRKDLDAAVKTIEELKSQPRVVSKPNPIPKQSVLKEKE